MLKHIVLAAFLTCGAAAADAQRLPDWCNVYAGLTDDEVAEVEKVILQRADLTRHFD